MTGMPGPVPPVPPNGSCASAARASAPQPRLSRGYLATIGVPSPPGSLTEPGPHP